MVENYDILKQNNLNQLVTEYEEEKYNWAKELAFNNLEVDVSDDEEASAVFWEGVRKWTILFYDNARVNLVRKYAAIYDAKNIDKYPVVRQLPKIDYIMKKYTRGNYFPFTYTTLREVLLKHNRGH